LTWDLEKKRRKLVVHHTPTGGSTVVVAISVPLPYGLFLMELIDLPFHGSDFTKRKTDAD
jgi:hypothetical protein